MSVMRGRPCLIVGVSHYPKILDTDFLEIPTVAAVSSELLFVRAWAFLHFAGGVTPTSLRTLLHQSTYQ